MKQINLFSILANKSIFFALCVGNKKSELKGVTALKRLSTLRQTAHNQEVVSLNPGAVFWIGILDGFKTLSFLLFGKIETFSLYLVK
jgi:hypothetical protein